jgi:polar amino acid transport system ATP-binding protein
MSMIKTIGIYKTFHGKNGRGPLEVLKDVSLTLEQKDVVCIIGT